MESLPGDLCRNIICFLSAPDILTCLTLQKSWNDLGNSTCFWRDLLLRDGDYHHHHSSPSLSQDCYPDVHGSQDTPATISSCSSTTPVPTAAAAAAAQTLKRLFLIHSHANALRTVKWCHTRDSYHQCRHPFPREGHVMCALSGGERVIVAGGFCNDEQIHVLNLHGTTDTEATMSSGRNQASARRWNAVSPRGRERPSFCYGATLTALDDHRAVQFGGFLAGGYSRESNQVYLLTLEEDADRAFKWDKIAPSVGGTPDRPGVAPPPRAYHSATLIQNRYLLIIGGMQSHGSIADETILDTVTWKWLDVDVSEPGGASPSPRHGHSAVLDPARNRLVLFGGGNGSDLLRSGEDSAEVWELKFRSDLRTANDFAECLPGTWKLIHPHSAANSSSNGSETRRPPEASLSSSESLCLGRCHVGMKVARDMVLLAFGSGRPTTNGVLGYNLKTDSFVRPNIAGPIPFPRFTAAASMIGKEGGWLMVHGGYSVQENGSKGDTILLDLAPGLMRRFDALPMDDNVRSQPPIRDQDLADQTQDGMLRVLVGVAPEERQTMARLMLQRLLLSGQLGGRTAFILSLVANGSALFGDEGQDNDDENNHDSDSEENQADDEEFAHDNEMSGEA